jgi:hypothetical protein
MTFRQMPADDELLKTRKESRQEVLLDGDA